jgi:3,4-dihydroxy 2-butanone 4-phosphate synthase/GTP cyclohydrolase II
VTVDIITKTDNQVFISEYDADIECPSKGFWSIPNAIEVIRQGNFVIAVDDEDKENEGDLIMAALYQDYPYSLLLL